MVSFYVCRCSCFTRICRKETSSWTNIRSKSSGELREYSRTSRKRPPKMQRLWCRLRQNNHRGTLAMHMCRAVQFHLVTKVLRIFLSNIVHTANIELTSDLTSSVAYNRLKTMENYYTVSQKSDCGRVHEVLGLGFTRDLYIYLFIYFTLFLTVDLSPGHDIQILVRSCFGLRSWFYQVQVRSQFLISKVRLTFLFFLPWREINYLYVTASSRDKSWYMGITMETS